MAAVTGKWPDYFLAHLDNLNRPGIVVPALTGQGLLLLFQVSLLQASSSHRSRVDTALGQKFTERSSPSLLLFPIHDAGLLRLLRAALLHNVLSLHKSFSGLNLPTRPQVTSQHFSAMSSSP